MFWNIFTPILTLVLGYALGFITDIIKSKIELGNTYKEIVFHKRLEEIEEILPVIKELNFSDETDKGQLFPCLMYSKEILKKYRKKIGGLLKSSCSFWISNEIRYSLGRLNQYLYYIGKETESLPQDKFIEVGIQIQKDFLDFFYALSNMIKTFINSIPKDKIFELSNEEIEEKGIFDFERNSIYFKDVRKDLI